MDMTLRAAVSATKRLIRDPAGCRRPESEAYLNEHLMSDLGADLFLAQLSNPLAGNSLDRAWRHRLITHLHGRGAVRRRRGGSRMRG
jgi:hypothetical protein